MKPATITPLELSQRLALDPALTLLDVRTPAEFAEARASAARNLPLPDVTAAALSTLGHTDATAPVYLLCQAGKRAETAATRLSAAGFAQPVVVLGGTEAWLAAGLPAVRGTNRAIGIERQVRIGAGALVFGGVVLAHTVHPGFVWLAGFVGAGLVFAGVTGFCGMGLLLARAPWNRRRV
jgi:rhodanese-related sulfurtransferase